MGKQLIGHEWRREYMVPFRYPFKGEMCHAIVPRDRRWGIALEFKLQDLWIGAYWARDEYGDQNIWVCLLPMLPIRIWWTPPFEAEGEEA